MSLQQGQVVRTDNTLYRVVYVNDCRARLVPLTKHGAPINISPNSILEVVEDLERAQTEIELAEAEAELAELRAALAQQRTDERALAEAEAELNALRKLVNQSDE